MVLPTHAPRRVRPRERRPKAEPSRFWAADARSGSAGRETTGVHPSFALRLAARLTARQHDRAVASGRMGHTENETRTGDPRPGSWPVRGCWAHGVRLVPRISVGSARYHDDAAAAAAAAADDDDDDIPSDVPVDFQAPTAPGASHPLQGAGQSSTRLLNVANRSDQPTEALVPSAVVSDPR
jgi:hypothetical protein